ncbi:MAG: S-layer homology domain-containing protein [Clostridia bacterium]|nr:S-layer homology domain-containing protein [Clostridia bacterium]
MKTKRILSLLLVLCMLLSTAPISAFAEEITAAEAAVIYLTVNNKGVIATDTEGGIMANREVTVTDRDSNGYLTYDEALKAAHEAFNNEDGYIGGDYVTKLWGEQTSNILFFINNTGLTEGVGTSIISAGDRLTASLNKDDKTYADWYTFFDKSEETIEPNEEITLTLKGHPGMTGGDDTTLQGIEIGIWNEGEFSPIENAETDEGGNITISFPDTGIYYITADGTVEAEVTDYNLYDMSSMLESENSVPVYGVMDYTTGAVQMAYTAVDYGEGPYPAGEIKYVDFNEWENNQDGYNTLQSNTLISNCPIIAPVCILTVEENSAAGEDTPPTTDDEDTGKPDAPTDNEKKDYDIVIPGALEKIAAKYINNTDEWTVMDMGAYEIYAPQTEYALTDEARQAFINSAISTIKDPSWAFSPDTAIDKAILGLAAIGKNPELIYLVNSNTAISAIEKLNGVDKSSSAWNAPYTLAAYNQGDYDTDSYEKQLVDDLLAGQKDDGSWDEWGTIDTTANVIAGLSFYKDREDVSTAIEKAINYLSTQQTAEGTFSDGYNGSNSNSTAMVVIGLCAAGVDLINDDRFIKGENNIIDGLLSFLVENKNDFGFSYTDKEAVNNGATEQSFRALIAFMQTIKTGGAYNVYDFSGSEFTPAREKSNGSSSSAPSEPSGDNITVTMTIKADTGYWLKNYTTTIPKEGATVYHAFVKVCSANSITHQGAAQGYVSSITKGNKTLAEFDKGDNSGWLYKVNGKLPTVGLTEFPIKDKDTIVWYYAEDWTKDPSAGHYGGSSSVSQKTENNSVVTTTKVSGEKATVTATESSIKDAISNAEKNNTASIVIAPTDTKNATDITLDIPANSVKEIAESKGLTLSVETTAGNVAISNEALNAIAEQIGDKALNVVIKTKLADEASVSEKIISKEELKNASIVEITITSGDTSIHTFGGNSLSVNVPVNESTHKTGKTYKVHIISADGSVETAYGKCTEKDGKLSVEVQTNHLSTFFVTDEEKSAFTDILNHWASDAIEYVYNHSIMRGVSETAFAPDDTMTRAMLVTVLYRLENPTEKAKAHSFTDVEDGAWYADAVSWAFENAMVSGVTETEFAPNADITREQMAAVMHRYAQYKKQDTSIGEDTNILSYTDAEEISEYAIPAMQWIVGAGLMKGETEATINPKNNSTRAQVSAILMRYLEQ